VNIEHNPQAVISDVLQRVFRAEKHFLSLIDNHLKCFPFYFRDNADLVFRDVFVVLTICSYNYKAFFFVVTIDKVFESGVEKEVGFHVSLEQTRKFDVHALFDWLPDNLLALWGGQLVTVVNAKCVVFDNNHKFHGVLAENKLESSICLKLFTIITLSSDREVKREVKEFLNSFNLN